MIVLYVTKRTNDCFVLTSLYGCYVVGFLRVTITHLICSLSGVFLLKTKLDQREILHAVEPTLLKVVLTKRVLWEWEWELNYKIRLDSLGVATSVDFPTMSVIQFHFLLLIIYELSINDNDKVLILVGTNWINLRWLY